MSAPELALTRKEAAKALKLGLNSIDGLIKTGELPSALVCGRRLIDIEDARAYLRRKIAEQRQPGDTNAGTGATLDPATSTQADQPSTTKVLKLGQKRGSGK